MGRGDFSSINQINAAKTETITNKRHGGNYPQRNSRVESSGKQSWKMHTWPRGTSEIGELKRGYKKNEEEREKGHIEIP